MPPKKRPQFMIVDGNAMLHRAWHAIPLLTTSKGEVVNAVFGFTQILIKALKDISPEYIAVTFDKKGPTFRHEAYTEYKATRAKQPDELYTQIDRIKEVLAAFRIPVFEKDGVEADDVIATLATRITEETDDIDVVIATGDMDTLQLVSDRVHVYTLRKGIADIAVYDTAAIEERFDGLTPAQITFFKALRGDPSDNIPGVKGIGEKGAIEIIKAVKSFDALYPFLEKHPDGGKKIKPPLVKKLLEHEEAARMSYQLVQLVPDVDIFFDKEVCAYHGPDREALAALFQELEFHSLMARIPMASGESEESGPAPTSPFTLLTSAKEEKEFLVACKKAPVCVVPVFHEEVFEGVAVYIPEGEATHALSWKENKKTLQTLCEDSEIALIVHDVKAFMHVMAEYGVAVKNASFDTMLAAYVLNPGLRTYTLESLIATFLGMSANGEGRELAARHAMYLHQLATHLQQELGTGRQRTILDGIEMPLVPVLFAMEEHGIAIDKDFFATLSRDIHARKDTLSAQIIEQAGEEFNIDSPLQLKEILFERLNITGYRIRRTKTGLSTAASELEKMKDAHPIISLILEYRELAKLLNTYIDVLPALASARTGRIHTTYNQTIASTGRLSSSSPNLQNIPTRTDVGRSIRKGFIAAPGYTLIAADYSQIELRIAASLANDTVMIEAFKSGIDIHRATAALMNHVTPEEVTAEMRRAAKAINFGVLYGMGPQGVAEGAGVSFGEAQKFIEQYFGAYPKIREYLDTTIAFAHANGYVETMFGRRRYIPEMQSRLPSLRRTGERMAVNMPIQGTQADIIKKAMIALHAFFEKKGYYASDSVRMLLQVHDELMFEIKIGEEAKVIPHITKIMESVVMLSTPLVVEVKKGANWGEMERIM